MRFLLILVVLVCIYLFLAKKNSNHAPGAAPVPPAAEVVEVPPSAPGSSPSTPAGSNILKRPLDRTHSVLDQAQKNKESNGF